jgi:excisionase family DNA binding protein
LLFLRKKGGGVMGKIFEDEKLYSPQEIADRIGITKEAVYKWIKGKKVRAYKVGKFWKIEGKELNEKIVKTNK